MLQKFRVLSAYVLFITMCLLGPVPHILLLVAANRLARLLGIANESAHRLRSSAWQVFWARPTFAIARLCLGLRVEFRMPERPIERSVRPCIIVSNHISKIDMLIIVVLLGRLGRREVRWIMAEEHRNKPLIPWACAEGGSEFVNRSDGDAARESVRRCAGTALIDQASIAIFPESTRFRQPKEGSEFTRVLPPKPGGFLVLRDVLPGFPVLSLTLHWEGLQLGGGLKGTGSFVDRRLIVDCRWVERMQHGDDAEFLLDDFRRKELLLAAS